MAKKEKEIEEVAYPDDPLYMEIEEKRTVFKKEYNKQKIINSVVLGITLLAIVLICVFLLKQTLIAMICIIVILVGSMVFSHFKKKKMDKLTNEYIEFFYNTQTKYVFNDNVNYVDVTNHPFEKLKPEEFINGGFVMNVTHLGSRSATYGQMSGLYFKAADTVARVTTNGVTETAFLGKYFMIELDREVKGKTLIYMGPEANNGAGPNDLDGLDEIHIPGLGENIKVWSSNKSITKVLTKPVIEAINAFKPNHLLEDICFSFKSNALYVAISYTDDMMVLPLFEPFKLEPVLQYKEDASKLAEFAKVFRKVINSKVVKDAEALLTKEEEEAKAVLEAASDEVKEEEIKEVVEGEVLPVEEAKVDVEATEAEVKEVASEVKEEPVKEAESVEEVKEEKPALKKPATKKAPAKKTTSSKAAPKKTVKKEEKEPLKE